MNLKKHCARNKVHLALILCCATVQLAIAQIGVSRIIPVEETKKLKAIRNEIGSIKNLDALYEDRKHKNGLQILNFAKNSIIFFFSDIFILHRF